MLSTASSPILRGFCDTAPCSSPSLIAWTSAGAASNATALTFPPFLDRRSWLITPLAVLTLTANTPARSLCARSDAASRLDGLRRVVVGGDLRRQQLVVARGLDRLLEARLALIGRGRARLGADDHDLAAVRQQLHQLLGGEPAAFFLVGGDERERHRRVDRVARRHQRDARVLGLLDRRDQRLRVGRVEQDRVRLLLDHGLQHRCLLHRVEVRRAVDDRLKPRLRASSSNPHFSLT